MNEADQEKLILAMKHAESINDAWLQYTEAFKTIEPWQKLAVLEEISQRIWGVIYLLQAIGNPEFESRKDFKRVVGEAESWDSCVREGDDE